MHLQSSASCRGLGEATIGDGDSKMSLQSTASYPGMSEATLRDSKDASAKQCIVSGLSEATVRDSKDASAKHWHWLGEAIIWASTK